MNFKIRFMVNGLVSMAIIIAISLMSYAQDDFQSWMEQENKEFQAFIEEADKEFSDFLKKEWKEMHLTEEKKPLKTPKPKVTPKAKPKELPDDFFDKDPVFIKDIPIPKPKPKLPKEEDIKPEPTKQEKKKEPNRPAKKPKLPKPPKEAQKPKIIPKKTDKTASFYFYGTPVRIGYDRFLSKIHVEQPVSNIAISNAWKNLSRTKYKQFLTQTTQLKTQLRLNDWGYCLLLKEAGKNIYRKKAIENTVFVWFMLVKSGYDARIGHRGGHVYLLLPSDIQLYSIPYYRLGTTKKYFAFNLDERAPKASRVKTYDGYYPDAKTNIDFNILKTPNLKKAYRSKRVNFAYGDRKHYVSYRVNKNIVDFFEYYPQTAYEVYFNATIDPETQYDLLKKLKYIIQGKSEAEAVNMLLRFSQTAFLYKTDNEQFGREKPLFSEETLYYTYSDCEDRSVLFAFLVKRLTGLEVIGLRYPNHIAAAVKFRGSVNGDSVSYRGDTYIICDPTYVFSNIGMTMPKHKNNTPEVIKISLKGWQ